MSLSNKREIKFEVEPSDEIWNVRNNNNLMNLHGEQFSSLSSLIGYITSNSGSGFTLLGLFPAGLFIPSMLQVQWRTASSSVTDKQKTKLKTEDTFYFFLLTLFFVHMLSTYIICVNIKTLNILQQSCLYSLCDILMSFVLFSF